MYNLILSNKYITLNPICFADLSQGISVSCLLDWVNQVTNQRRTIRNVA